MRKVLLFMLLMIFPTIALALPIGDVDGDNYVKVRDYVLIRKHILGTSLLAGEELKRADVDGNNSINVSDYIAIRKIILGIPIVVTPTEVSNTDYFEAYFLNSINNPQFVTNYTTNDAFIFKTSSGKYILLDTGVKSNEIKQIIYNKLKELQGTSTVTIDYMIISHMHSDHYGNAINIIKDDKFIIKNLIIKSEYISGVDEKIVKAAKAKNIKMIDTNNIKEGTYYEIDNNVKAYLFNVKDIYDSKDVCDVSDYFLRFTNNTESTSIKYAKDTNGKYIYFNGKDYINHMKNGTELKFYTDNKPKQTVDISKETVNERMQKKFYAYISLEKDDQVITQCTSNANSLAVVFEVKTSNGNKYVYIPSDLENAGYSPFGEYDSTYETMINGTFSRYYFKYKIIDNEPRFVLENNKLVQNTSIKAAKKPMEYVVATELINKFSDIKTNLVIYQQSHHGINNTWQAMKTLKINRSGVYTIAPSGSSPTTNNQHRYLESAYLLNKTNIMYTGGKDKKGIKCSITGTGNVTCTTY